MASGAYASVTTKLVDFASYVSRQWIYNDAMPVTSWSVYLLDDHRTDNDLEGGNLAFLLRIGRHRTLRKLFAYLAAYHKRHEADEATHRGPTGRSPSSRKKIYIRREADLSNLKGLYQAGQSTLPQYIFNVAKLLGGMHMAPAEDDESESESDDEGDSDGGEEVDADA